MGHDGRLDVEGLLRDDHLVVEDHLCGAALGLGPRLVEAQMQAVAPRVQSVEAVAQIRAALRVPHGAVHGVDAAACRIAASRESDRKSTRLNSSHVAISYAVFCLKKKITHNMYDR